MAIDKRSALWRFCAACGATDCDIHEHHLVPRSHGGADLPTVNLCTDCHGKVHRYYINPAHSELTKAGQARAKARGVKLGNPQLKPGDPEGARKARAARSRSSREHATNVLPHIDVARNAGAKTLREIAAALTERGIKPPNGGGAWHASQVKRVIEKAIHNRMKAA
jgi:hypothetical protein